jgi:hypothetical protein
MTTRGYPAVIVAAMLVLTAFASMPVAAASHESVEVETVGALDVTAQNATLVGNLTELDNASSADVWFEYWEEGDRANNSTTTAVTLSEPGAFSASVDGLANNTTYVYVAHAATENVSDEGEPVEFTTGDRFAPLGVETLPATDVTNTSATLNGELTGLSGEAEADVWFEYWPQGDSANSSTTAIQTLSGTSSFSDAVSGLENDTTYVYVAHAAANNSTVAGENTSFTTDDGVAEAPTWDGEGPFGQWLTSVLKNLVPPDSDVPLGQIVSDIVTSNNPGSEHRSEKANPGGNGNGPPDHAKGGGDEADDGDDGELEIAVDGELAANETITVTVTHDGSTVENATVSVDGEDVGTTDADGELEVTLPDDSGAAVTLSAEHDDLEGAIELELAD